MNRSRQLRNQRAGAAGWLLVLGLALLLPGWADITGGGATGGRGDRDRDRDRNQERERGRDRDAVAVVAPVPREVAGEVRCGESVNLLLQAFGTREAPVEFELVTAPQIGTVTAITPVPDQPNQALLRFDASAVTQPGVAVFEFRARRLAGGPRSGAVRGVVRVVAPEVRLFTPEVLDFGEVALGDAGKVSLDLENGSRLPLSLGVDLTGLPVGWGDDGELSRQLQIPATEMAQLPLVWNPQEVGRLLGRVPVATPAGVRELALRGTAVAAVAVSPTWLEPGSDAETHEAAGGGAEGVENPETEAVAAVDPFGTEAADSASAAANPANPAADPANATAAAPEATAPDSPPAPPGGLPELRIFNRSRQVLPARLEGGAVLGLPATLELPARGEITLQPHFTGAAGSGGQGQLRLSTARGEILIPWTVPAIPATLELTLADGAPLPEIVNFGEVPLGEERVLPLRMRNVGGDDGVPQLRTKPPFSLRWTEAEAQPDAVLPAGASRGVELTVRGEVLGFHEGLVDFGFAERRRELPLQVGVVARENAGVIPSGGATAPLGAGTSAGEISPAASESGAATGDSASAATAKPGENGTAAGRSGSSPALLNQLARSAPGSSTRTRALEQLLFAPKPPRDLKFPIILTITEMKRRSLELSWLLPKGEGLENLDWKLYWLAAGVDEWQEIAVPVALDQAQQIARVRLEKLRPGASFRLRITARGRDGKVLADSAWPIALPPPRPWWQVVWPVARWVILGLSVAGLGWYAWQRWVPPWRREVID